MSEKFEPLVLRMPITARRRPGRGRFVPPDPLVVARREEIARRLKARLAEIDATLQNLSDNQRKNVFLKVEHARPINLVGTGLKPITEPGEHFTLAVPREANLGPLEAKVEAFGSDPLSLITYGGEVHEQPKNYDLVSNLQDITYGEPKDRLSLELIERYDSLVKEDRVVVEMDLVSVLYRGQRARTELHAILHDLDIFFRGRTRGQVIEHEEYDRSLRVIVSCTGEALRELVEDDVWQTRISWFENRPTFQIYAAEIQQFDFQTLGPLRAPHRDAPTVCIIDSGVSSGNPFLEPVVEDALVRSYLHKAPTDPYDSYGHGSGVASLVAYYALNIAPGASNEGKVWLASARILDENNEFEERLFSLAIERVVRDFAPLGVKIFNLSANITNRQWNLEARRRVPRKSWVARKIDRLSREYDIVFVVSTGNLETTHVRWYLEDAKQYPDYLLEEESRILDPGQAALAISVGGLAATTFLTGGVGTTVAIGREYQPSPFTRCGPGMNREIKPELVEFAGNYARDLGTNTVRRNPALGILMASHQHSPALQTDAGTSFAAPRVAHHAALILQDLEALGINATASLLKAFLVNSAIHEESGNNLQAVKDSLNVIKANSWRNVIGYGKPNHARALDCDPHSVVLFYQGELAANHVGFFEVPIPASLAGNTGKSRITVTVSYASEVQRWGLERYLGTTLQWRVFRGDVDQNSVITAMAQDSAGAEAAGGDEADVSAEMPQEIRFIIGVQQRSRGTIQHDVYEWTQHQEAFSEGHYTLAVATFEKWNRTNPPPVPYAVVVRIEDLSRSVEIYSEIRAAVEVEAEAEEEVNLESDQESDWLEDL